jgi:hypothetical protein
MATQERAVDTALEWIDTAVAHGCPRWEYQEPTRETVADVLRHTREAAGPDAVQAVAERLVTRAKANRPPSATQARAIAREEVRDRGVEITMASPLARSCNG